MNRGGDESLQITINTNEIWIHDPSTPPKNHFENNRNGDMFVASINSFIYFVFERLVEKKLRDPFNRCLEDIDLFKTNQTVIDYMKSLNRSLTIDLCVDVSFAIHYLEKNPCNCTASNITFYNFWNKCVLKGTKYNDKMDK